MFRALLTHLQEALHKRHLLYAAPGLEFHSNPGAANWHNTHASVFRVAPSEDEQVMLETCRGLLFLINWIKNASRWFYCIDTLIIDVLCEDQYGLKFCNCVIHSQSWSFDIKLFSDSHGLCVCVCVCVCLCAIMNLGRFPLNARNFLTTLTYVSHNNISDQWRLFAILTRTLTVQVHVCFYWLQHL
jgi:hypothetical protein